MAVFAFNFQFVKWGTITKHELTEVKKDLSVPKMSALPQPTFCFDVRLTAATCILYAANWGLGILRIKSGSNRTFSKSFCDPLVTHPQGSKRFEDWGELDGVWRVAARSQGSPEAITGGRKRNYARLPVSLSLWLCSGQLGSNMPHLVPSEPSLWVPAVAAQINLDNECRRREGSAVELFVAPVMQMNFKCKKALFFCEPHSGKSGTVLLFEREQSLAGGGAFPTQSCCVASLMYNSLLLREIQISEFGCAFFCHCSADLEGVQGSSLNRIPAANWLHLSLYSLTMISSPKHTHTHTVTVTHVQNKKLMHKRRWHTRVKWGE